MKIFIIPSWYPTQAYPSTGIFFKEQAEQLAKMRPEWKVGISIWGSHEPKLWLRLKRPLEAVIRLSTKMPFKVSQQMLLPNCIEFFTPAFTWNRNIKNGNLSKILESNDNNFQLFTAYFGKPDLIHAQVAFPGGYLAMCRAQKYQIPYIITEHMSPFPMPSLKSAMNKYILPAMKNANFVMSVSRGLQDQIKEYGVRSELISNFIDQDTFNFKPVIDGVFTFLAIGRLEQQKGYELLLNSTSRLLTKNVDFRLRIGGSGKLERSLKRHCKRLGLSEKVIWLGELSREEVVQELGDCQCFVSTSLHENQPVAIMEAMAIGRPILTTAWVGSDELIVDSELGQIIGKQDPELFGDSMLEMMERSYDAQKIARLFDEHFGAKNTVDKLEETFLKTLHK